MTGTARFRPRQRGFTLLEMVVALAIFSIMAIIAYRGLAGILDAREVLQEESQRLSRLQFAMALMERDIRQAVPRSVRDELGDPQPALAGDSRRLVLTRLGWSNPAGLARSSLERVEYAWDNGLLQRIGWPVLDRGPSNEPQIHELLEGTTSLRFRFLDGPDRWLDQWPPVAGEDPPEWPLAIQLVLQSPEFGSLRRTFGLVAQADPVDVPGAGAEGAEGG